MEKDQTLYHYTSLEAFRSIVESQTIRATESKYLNDATEFAYGIDLAKEVAQEVMEEIGKSIPKDVDGLLCSGKMSLYTYIFSLSSSKDFLSQWRAYCPEGGVSIGFSKIALELLTIPQRGYKLAKCIYSIDEQRARLKALMIEMSDDDEEDFLGKLKRLIATFKHPAFEEEQEYRIISYSHFHYPAKPDYPRSWRTNGNMLIPFTEFYLTKNYSEKRKRAYENAGLDLADYSELSSDARKKWEEKIHSVREVFTNAVDYGLEPFREVMIGPYPHQDLIEYAVRDFLAEKTFYGKSGRSPRGGIMITKSKIPYEVSSNISDSAQIRHRHPMPTLIRHCVLKLLYLFVIAQIVPYRVAQGAGAFAVQDTHARHFHTRGFQNKVPHLFQTLLYALAANVQFIIKFGGCSEAA